MSGLSVGFLLGALTTEGRDGSTWEVGKSMKQELVE